MNDDPQDPAALERMRAALEASGRYRVLERLEPRRAFMDPEHVPPGTRLFTAMYVDTETTGLDSASDKIIEFAALAFDYDALGNVYGVRELFDAFEDPGEPLSQEVIDLTGITDDDVRGRRFDDELVAGAVRSVDLVVAHNAAFDRPFLERRFPVFASKPWACSANDVPWRDLGYASRSLEFLAFRQGFFFDAHRALVDCRAGLELLARPLPEGGPPAMRALRAHALTRTVRLWAEGAPFETKDLLKARGYRFNGPSRTWWVDLPQEAHEPELEWLTENVYGREVALPYVEIGAVERYSDRVPEALPQAAKRR